MFWQEADEEIVETMEECLQRFIALEDEENTQLAQALNLATLGQVRIVWNPDRQTILEIF